MNCPECGGAYMYGGGNSHSACRELAAKRVDRNKRVDILLDIFKEDIERKMLERA